MGRSCDWGEAKARDVSSAMKCGPCTTKSSYVTTSSSNRLKTAFLFCVASVYLVAFSSLYIQIPGLYGDNGLLPLRRVLDDAPDSFKNFSTQPSLLRFGKTFHLDPESSMDLACLAGMVLATLCMVTGGNLILFAALWLLYLSVYIVGQTFLGFQWDIMLLEIGLLSVLMAPLRIFGSYRYAEHDSITMWLFKWLLFRLMFAAGVVKLQSNCPTWWGLVALDWHYESQCIPTPLAWYFHYHPQWFRKLSTAAVFVIEIIVPFLFFAPTKALKWFAFICQLLLQVLIILTGNYNFFNWLTIILCLPLLDCSKPYRCPDISLKEKLWARLSRISKFLHSKFITRLKLALSILFSTSVIITIIAFSVKYFNITIDKEHNRINSKVAFTRAEFDTFVFNASSTAIWIGAFCLGYTIIDAIVRSLLMAGTWPRIFNLIGSLVMAVVAIFMFCVSLVPLSYLDGAIANNLPQTIKAWHQEASVVHSVNSYGLFRRMTGIDGRPEVVISGSMDNKTWLEYEFLYKPGDLSRAPPVVAPHQPRLDWQMWFAALGEWHRGNFFYVVLVHRLFNNEPAVLDLMGKNPFPNQPPKYIKATWYKYHYAAPNPPTSDWWTRDHATEYMDIHAADEVNLVKYLRNNGIIPRVQREEANNLLEKFLRAAHHFCNGSDGFLFVVSILVVAWILSLLCCILWPRLRRHVAQKTSCKKDEISEKDEDKEKKDT